MDSTADHNLYNCNCTNCDTSSYVLCDNPNQAFLGWVGGCGDIVCTGVRNYLVHDFTGGFLGFKGVVIPNPTIGAN
jgi:threonine dehydrogenase-like Zn-dependent dehydrogenase